MWTLGVFAANPPLPRLSPDGSDAQGAPLEQGSFLLRLFPAAEGPPPARALVYEGPLRIESCQASRRMAASADLYQVRGDRSEPVIDGRLPVYARAGHRYYLRLDSWATRRPGLELTFSCHQYQRRQARWVPTPRVSLELQGEDDSWRGEIRNEHGDRVGRATMTRLGPTVRCCRIRLVGVDGVPLPTCSDGVSWADVFERVGWGVELEQRPDAIEDREQPWRRSELHQALERFCSPHPDSEIWTYTLLCVSRIDGAMGLMFDAEGADVSVESEVANYIPREGAALAAKHVLPKRWKNVGGEELHRSGRLYLRTAVHEIAHAMNLAHELDDGIMRPISRTDEDEFPHNQSLEFSARSRALLMHAPDLWVRPGGIPWSLGFSHIAAPEEDVFETPEGLRLELAPLTSQLDFGAPVRLAVTLAGTTDPEIPVPGKLALTRGWLRGELVPPSSGPRRFSPLVLKLDDSPLTMEPCDPLRADLTLLRGPDGALLPSPGFYTARVELVWYSLVQQQDGPRLRVFRLGSTCSFLVNPPSSSSHAEAALGVLAEPFTLLPLVLGRDPDGRGTKAIQRTLHQPDLGRHYAAIEARRVAEERGEDWLYEASHLLAGGFVATRSEVSDLIHELVREERANSAIAFVCKGVQALRETAERMEVDPELIDRLEKSFPHCFCARGVR